MAETLHIIADVVVLFVGVVLFAYAGGKGGIVYVNGTRYRVKLGGSAPTEKPGAPERKA